MKIMTQMADKDRPCTPLCFLLPTPHLCFQFSELHQVGGSRERQATAERGRRDEEGNREGSRTGTRNGKLWQSEEEQTGFKSNLTGHNVLEGVGLGQETADIGITNNPTRKLVLLWERSECRHQPRHRSLQSKMS